MVENRGRKTALDFITGIIPGGGRPEPPEDLPPDEAEIWRTVVGAMPPNWFGPQTRGVLRRYCQYACASEPVMREVRRAKAMPLTSSASAG